MATLGSGRLRRAVIAPQISHKPNRATIGRPYVFNMFFSDRFVADNFN